MAELITEGTYQFRDEPASDDKPEAAQAEDVTALSGAFDTVFA